MPVSVPEGAEVGSDLAEVAGGVGVAPASTRLAPGFSRPTPEFTAGGCAAEDPSPELCPEYPARTEDGTEDAGTNV